MSIKSLSTFFAERRREQEVKQAAERTRAIQLATAAVFVEVAYADSSLSIEEERRMVGYLRDTFQLDDDAARELMEAADELRAHSIDHWNVTNTIRKNTSLEERIEIVKNMWRLVYADGQMHQYENYLVRKLADLLGLEHSVMIDAKMAVHAELRGN